VNHTSPEWLPQALKGDPDAFGLVVEEFQRPVFNLCYRMLGDPDEAEDAAQETFLRAYNGLRSYDSNRSFSTWLLSIAAHYCIDQIRRRRLVLLSMDQIPTLDPPDPQLGPEAATSRAEEQRRIQALLNTLGPQDRAAVIMLYWYDMSYEEIADATGLTVSAIKSRLHRARRDLASQWQNHAPANIETNQLELAANPPSPVERRRHAELRTSAF
jgi:RNA polymerase sigma-70 factor (ECF subfamily)